jgi:prolyl 4-hydroxylase
MVSLDDSKLRGGAGSSIFQQTLWTAAKEAVAKWIPDIEVEDLVECSLYGIRVYTEGAILSSHVDRLPQVISIIINVAQDVDEPWPLEIIGHDGMAHNITLNVGDWLLYESHSIIHGRPFPLKGRYYANLFLHLEPKGHSQLHHNHSGADANEDTNRQYKSALKNKNGGHENTLTDLPPYIIADSLEAELYRQEHESSSELNVQSTTPVHNLAANGKLNELIDYIAENQMHLINAKDHNGWTVSFSHKESAPNAVRSSWWLLDSIYFLVFLIFCVICRFLIFPSSCGGLSCQLKPLHEAARGKLQNTVFVMLELQWSLCLSLSLSQCIVGISMSLLL